MDFGFTDLVFYLLVGVAVYLLYCAWVRLKGYYLNSSAKHVMKLIWLIYITGLFEDPYPDFNYDILSRQELRKMRRLMPQIVDVALKFALEDLRNKGHNSEVYVWIKQREEELD